MGNCFVKHRGGKKKLKTRSLYSFCTNINKSGTYSETISGIKYDIECVTVPEVTDDNVDTVFGSVSSNEGYFLLLKTNYINISKTLTPPYPKKSFIIFCPTIEGTGTISMTGKGPNCLPEDILLFEEEEVKEVGRVLIPAYADNAKSATVKAYASDPYTTNVTYRKGIDGTGYNCGSGGFGGYTVNNWRRQCANVFVKSGTGYSYGGGAGTGVITGESTTYVSKPNDQIYPMRGGNGIVVGGQWDGSGGAGNPQGSPNNNWAPALNKKSGVGGRLIIFCIKNSISLKAEGCKAIPVYQNFDGLGFFSCGGSSGGGSINIFYIKDDNSIKSVSGGGYNPYYYNSGDNDIIVRLGGAGGNGTIVNTKCKKLAVYKSNKY